MTALRNSPPFSLAPKWGCEIKIVRQRLYSKRNTEGEDGSPKKIEPRPANKIEAFRYALSPSFLLSRL